MPLKLISSKGFQEKLISQRKEQIRKLTCEGPDGNLYFYYFMVDKDKYDKFLHEFATKKDVTLADYGTILGFCKGGKPSQSLIRFMMDTYGFAKEDLLI